MPTLLLITAVEMRRRLRQRSLYWVVAGLAALASLSVVHAAGDLAVRRESADRHAADLARDQVRARLPLLGWTPEPTLRAIRAPQIGSLAARGDDISLPDYFDFGPAGVVWARSVSADISQLDAGRLFDLEFITRVLGGFLALLLGIETIAAARTSGLLRAWDALGASPIVIVLGRLLGGWGVASAATGIVLGTAMISGIALLPSDARDVSIVVARCAAPALLYLGCLIGVGGALAVWCRRPVTALIAGIAIWMATALIGPPAAMLGTRTLWPDTLRMTMEARRDQVFADEIRAGEEAMGDALVSRIGEAPADVTVGALDAHHAEIDAVWLAHARQARSAAAAVEHAWSFAQRREANVDWLGGLINPGTAFHESFAALAGTGTLLARRWLEAVEERQGRLNQALFDNRPRVTVRVPSQGARQVMPFDRHAGLAWPEVPALQAPAMTAAGLWRSAAGPLAALVFYIALAVIAAVAGARRRRL